MLTLVLTDDYIEQTRRDLVELPDAKKARFVNELGLTKYDAMVICENKEDRKSTRLNSSHWNKSRMPSSA